MSWRHRRAPGRADWPSGEDAAHPAYDPDDPFAPQAVRSAGVREPDDPLALGPLRKAYLIWLGGASCEGCTVAVTGGTHPRVEQLLEGAIPGLPRIELIQPLLAIESGPEYVHNLELAARGELDAPYIVTFEGSVVDETTAGEGFWSGLGADPRTGRQLTSTEWLERLAPGAAAVIAVGTCAAWGGIPAAEGNATGARGVGDHLGRAFRSAGGVPVVNIPGCAPVGDNYLETAAALLLFLNGLAPLPELDELGRPAWLYGRTVHASCARVDYYDQGVFALGYGDKGCLVELGCWGPVVQCNMGERGVIDGQGGCMQIGGICIGCTMPGFPDRFTPFYQAPPDSALEPPTARVAGGFLRRARREREAAAQRAAWPAPVPALLDHPTRPAGLRSRHPAGDEAPSRFYGRRRAR